MYRKMFFLGLILPSIVFAETINFKNFLKNSLQENPDILVKKYEHEAQRHVLRAEKGAYLPNLDILAHTGQMHYSTKRKITNTHSSNNHPNHKLTVRITQNVFNGLNTKYKVQEAENKLLYTNHLYNEEINTKAYELAKKYFEIRRLQRLLKVSKISISIHTDILSKVNQLVKNNLLAVTEMNIIKSKLHETQSNLYKIETDLKIAKAELQEITGKKALKKLSNPNLVIKNNIDNILKILRNKNHSIIAAQYNIKAAQAEHYQTKFNYRPKIDLVFDASREFNKYALGQENVVSGLIKGSYNIFNGGADKAKNRESFFKMKIAEQKRRKILMQIETDTRVAYEQYHKHKKQSKVLHNNVIINKTVWNDYKAKFSTNKVKHSDLLRVSILYLKALNNLITADESQDIYAAKVLSFTSELI